MPSSIFTSIWCRIRTTRVLVVGVEGLTVEVSKNLVLAGIKTITLLDHRTISSKDLSANFMAGVDDIGRNVSYIIYYVYVYDSSIGNVSSVMSLFLLCSFIRMLQQSWQSGCRCRIFPR